MDTPSMIDILCDYDTHLGRAITVKVFNKYAFCTDRSSGIYMREITKYGNGMCFGAKYFIVGLI